MRAIETENDELSNILPKTYNRLENSLLRELLKSFNSIDLDRVEGDAFGKIYEYFLGRFAMTEGQKGGEFFTPTALVKLIVEVIEPYQGRVYDPACGSGGMFVQSAEFIKRHQQDPNATISIFGQEKVAETVRLCKMNLAVHGLSGDVKQGNTYYEDIHRSMGKFDFVMANPPFNVDKVDKERLAGDVRVIELGIPKADNANYLWIHFFYSALSEQGRAGFVMATSASDARGSELEIRKKLIQAGVVDVMIAIGSNFFYTVTLPCTLWFLDKGKTYPPDRDVSGKDVSAKRLYRDCVLFIDARHIYQQVDRAHREFTSEQIEFIANIVRLYRGEALENANSSQGMMQEQFPDGEYIDIAGLCKVATVAEIEEQGFSLNLGRYVGVAARAIDDFDFLERLEELNEELEMLNAEAGELEQKIAENIIVLLQEGKG